MASASLASRFRVARERASAKDLDGAIALCHAILAEEPTHRGALDLLGFAHFFKQEYAVAEEFCRRTLAVHPGHAYAHKGLGLCLARQGRLEEGVRELRAAIALEPAFFDPYWDVAVVLAEAGQNAEAATLLEESLERCPAQAERARARIRWLRAQPPGVSLPRR